VLKTKQRRDHQSKILLARLLADPKIAKIDRRMQFLHGDSDETIYVGGAPALAKEEEPV
jgi:hypothetical protein